MSVTTPTPPNSLDDVAVERALVEVQLVLQSRAAATLKSITHHYSHFNWIFSGSDLLVVEGTSHGEHQDGPWRAGVPEWGAGRWCDVFEIRDWLIQRCFIYLDPTTPAGTPPGTRGSRPRNTAERVLIRTVAPPDQNTSGPYKTGSPGRGNPSSRLAAAYAITASGTAMDPFSREEIDKCRRR